MKSPRFAGKLEIVGGMSDALYYVAFLNEGERAHWLARIPLAWAS